VRCVKLVSSSALSALSERAFVQRYFAAGSPEFAQARVLLKEIKTAFIANLRTVAWMDAATQKGALEKADKMALNLGGPSAAYKEEADATQAPIKVDPEALLTNAVESSKALVGQRMQGIGEPLHRAADEWSMTATTVNAYYDAAKNAMFVPAGTLQPPFFELARPAAMNFGAIGAIMGHEMTHGFDLQGALLDYKGRERDWWSLDAANQFKRRSSCVDTVFNVIGAPKLYARPQTLSEDLADVGGVKVAMEAYQAWHTRARGAAPGEQELKEFFLAFSQNWCYKERKLERAVLAQDVHAPGELRSNGPLSMTDIFSLTFQCPAGSRMNPAEKCGMWKDITGEELLFQTRLQQLSRAGLGHDAAPGASTQTLVSWRGDRGSGQER